ncbi:MAG: class I SAM-dependent methyltransferase [Vicingus serpentipes]|nr:class I SAM-dependent methyltransferase [Vicingus serpentipes]
MSKLKKLITAVQILIKKPYMLNKVIDDESIHQEAIVKENPQLKNGFPVLDLLDVALDFDTTITPFCFLDGGSLITDLALLKGLAKQKPNCTYFEIGTWRGESVANVASVAKNCYTLNLSNEALRNMGYDKEYLQQQEFFSKNLKNVTHLKGNSLEFDFSPYYNQCDVVFVDGDHHYESVVNDTKIAFQLLKDENSIIVWHDYASNPGKVRWDILRGIYNGTPIEKRKNLFSVSNTLCAVYTNSPSAIVENKITPNKVFDVAVSAKKL